MYFSTSSFFCWKQKHELAASLAIPLSAMVTVTAGCDCVNFLSWLQRCRGNPDINVCRFGVLFAMSLLTPPPLLVKSGQWKLFLAGVCQTSPWDYLRSGRLCLENVFSLISIQACSVQKPACDVVRTPPQQSTNKTSLLPLACASGRFIVLGQAVFKNDINWYVFIWKVYLGE